MSNMVQYGVWSNCCNACEFCLREDRIPYSRDKMLKQLDGIKRNINYVDWENKFSYGISLLGGELYYITDPELQDSFLELIDIIIEKVLKVSKNRDVKYSTVTNGLYDPTFLFKVIDKIRDAVGMDYVDVNFSYDLKYRYKSESDRLLCLDNIHKFRDRYDYRVGVQMILTQYVIDMVNNGELNLNELLETDLKGCFLSFLYPHKIRTGKVLTDFNFKRRDFLKFIVKLRETNPDIFKSFFDSTHNSATFKYTGYLSKKDDYDEQPVLSDGKEIVNPICGHSILYQCYADSDKCMLCDLDAM